MLRHPLSISPRTVEDRRDANLCG